MITKILPHVIRILPTDGQVEAIGPCTIRTIPCTIPHNHQNNLRSSEGRCLPRRGWSSPAIGFYYRVDFLLLRNRLSIITTESNLYYYGVEFLLLRSRISILRNRLSITTESTFYYYRIEFLLPRGRLSITTESHVYYYGGEIL